MRPDTPLPLESAPFGEPGQEVLLRYSIVRKCGAMSMDRNCKSTAQRRPEFPRGPGRLRRLLSVDLSPEASGGTTRMSKSWRVEHGDGKAFRLAM